MSKPEDQLAAVAMQFKQWRLSKKHNNSAAPEHLRQQVVVLAKHFTFAQIKSALNLSNGVLFRWKKQLSTKANSITPVDAPLHATEFIALPQQNVAADNAITLELCLGDQCQIRLSGDISTAQLEVFTRNIFMYKTGALG